VWRAVSASDVDKRRREWLEARADAVATSRREQAHSPKVPARECQGATESPGDSPARESEVGREERAHDAAANDDEAGEANKAATDADQAAAAQRATYKRAKRAAKRASARMEATRQDLHVDPKAGAAPASAAKADGAPAVTDAAVTDAGTAVTDAAVTDAGTVTDAVTASVAKDGVSFTVKGLTLEREAAGTRVSIESLASRGRRVNRPGTAPPSEDGTSDAGLPVGGEPEPAESDDGGYDGIDNLDGLFDDEPDDFAAAREVAAVEKEGATGTRGEAREQGGRTHQRNCTVFTDPQQTVFKGSFRPF
jgi:hypothetical protein